MISGTSYTDKKVETGIPYTYRIKTMAKVGTKNNYSSYSNVLSGYTTGSISGTGVENTGTGLKLKWNALSNTTGYEIYRSTDNSSFKKVKTAAASATSFSNVSVDTGTVYYYKLRAVFSINGETVYSEYSDTVSEVAVKSPSLTDAKISEDGNAVLTFEPVNGASGYAVYRQVGTKAAKECAVITDTEFTDADIASEKDYTYSVCAVVKYGGDTFYSPASNSIKVSVPKSPVLKTISNADGKIKITWTKLDDASGYRIYRSTDGKKFSCVKTSTGTSFSNVSVTAGKEYYYKLVAVYDDGNTVSYSACSNVLSAVASK